MKLKFSLIACFLIISTLKKSLFSQPVNINDSLALVDLYNSTHGSNWTQNYNWLTGPVRSWFGITVEGSRVVTVTLDFNNLNGPLPTSLGNLTAATDISFDINHIGGTIPPSMGNLVNLRSLYMYKCHFTGTIPVSFGNLKSLEILVLHNNELTGNIPASLGKLKNLDALYLFNNYLSGNIPLFIFKSPTLYNLDIQGNELSFNYNIPPDSLIKAGNYNFNLNQFTFDGLEYVAQKSIPNNFYVSYAHQAIINIHQHGNKLAVSAGGTLSNNTYRWYKVGKTGSVTIQGDSVYTPLETGRYYAAVSNSIATNLKLMTDTVAYTASKNNNINISVYPNPVKNSLFINGLDANAKTNLVVTGLGGKEYIHVRLDQQSAYTCDVSNLPIGNYIVNVQNGKNLLKMTITTY